MNYTIIIHGVFFWILNKIHGNIFDEILLKLFMIFPSLADFVTTIVVVAISVEIQSDTKCQRLIMLIKLPSHFPFLLLCKQSTKRSIIYGLSHTPYDIRYSCVLFVDDSKDGTQIKCISLHRKIIMIVFLWFGFVYAMYWKWCTRESQPLQMPNSKYINIFFVGFFPISHSNSSVQRDTLNDRPSAMATAMVIATAD